MAWEIVLIIFLFLIGLIVGLLSIMIGLKFPLKKKSLNNICDNCDEEYNLIEVLPIISHIINDGKCKYCGNKLNIFYPVLELLCGVLFSLSFVIYGLSYEMVVMDLITILLVIIYVSDFKYYIINDSPLLVCSIIILLFKFVIFGLKTFVLSFVSAIWGFVEAIMILAGNINVDAKGNPLGE
jgi:prepilin signal peptidase PulO-like enzyme (type II secretory pathway)